MYDLLVLVFLLFRQSVLEKWQLFFLHHKPLEILQKSPSLSSSSWQHLIFSNRVTHLWFSISVGRSSPSVFRNSLYCIITSRLPPPEDPLPHRRVVAPLFPGSSSMFATHKKGRLFVCGMSRHRSKIAILLAWSRTFWTVH